MTFGGQRLAQAPGDRGRCSRCSRSCAQLHELLWYLTEALTLPAPGRCTRARAGVRQRSSGSPAPPADLARAGRRRRTGTGRALLRRASELVRAAREPAPRPPGADLAGARPARRRPARRRPARRAAGRRRPARRGPAAGRPGRRRPARGGPGRRRPGHRGVRDPVPGERLPRGRPHRAPGGAAPAKPVDRLSGGCHDRRMPTLHHAVDGAGPTVLLLHAGVADLRMWDAQVADLVDAGYTAVRCDLRGFGGSGLEPGASYADAEDVLALLEELGVEELACSPRRTAGTSRCRWPPPSRTGCAGWCCSPRPRSRGARRGAARRLAGGGSARRRG